MIHVDLTRFGPFAGVMAVAFALVAAFAGLVLKMFGTVARWTWLTSGAPPFVVKTAPRGLAVALMAVIYVTINKSNYPWFAAVAVVCGMLAFVLIARFERARERYVMQIPVVGDGGVALKDKSIVVGLEQDIREPAKTALADARKKNASLSLREFMGGFGRTPYDPEALWDRTMLADIRSNLTVMLMTILLFGVMVLFISAFIIEVFNR